MIVSDKWRQVIIDDRTLLRNTLIMDNRTALQSTFGNDK